MSSMTERFRRWYEYEKTSNARVLEMLESVPPERRSEATFQKAIDKFVHAVVCRNLWLFRLGSLDSQQLDQFPTDTQLEQIPGLLTATYQQWDQYMAALSDETIAQPFEYQSTEGDRFRDRVEDVLVHLQGHMMYHRGQVATLVAMSGGQTVDTDYVFLTRKQIA